MDLLRATVGAGLAGCARALALAALLAALLCAVGAGPAQAVRPGRRAFPPLVDGTATPAGTEGAGTEGTGTEGTGAEGTGAEAEREEAPRRILPPSRERGATIAGIAVGAEARSEPGAGRGVWRVGTATSWSGEPQVLLVLGSAIRHGRQWLRVLLPIRPDGASGWIPRRNVVLMSTRYWVTVDRAARRVRVYRGGRLLHSYRSVVGKPSTPTPPGLAAIYEIDPQPDPAAFLGPWAMPLTALSGVLHSFEGGPGRIAIHGRDGASLLDPLGSALSHGCVRIDNGPVSWMAHHLPQGTPVRIFG